MFQEPIKYNDSGHFFYEAEDELNKVCNAPKDKDGVFKVIELRNGKVTLVFIGYSTDGLFNEIVYGVHHDKNPRKMGWAYQLLKDKTDALDIYWYVTVREHDPKKVQTDMLKDFIALDGHLPKWNK